MRRYRTSELLVKGLLCVGFVALTGAIVAAYTTPAVDYEVSLYAGTPTAFWGGFLCALLIGSAVALVVETRRLRATGLSLGGGAMVAFVSLPLLRGYHFFASADTMSHLGWVRDIATGTIDPGALIYPGIHVLAVLLGQLTNFGLPRSLMAVTGLFALLYVVFVALAVRALTGSDLGTAIGAISAFLLLPVNVVVVKLTAHPISQTILYTSFVFCLLFWFLAGDADRFGDRVPIGGLGALFSLALTALVLYHPLGATFVLILFATIAAVQLVARRRFDEGVIAGTRPLYVPTLFLAAWLGIWMFVAHPGLTGQAVRIGERVALFFRGGSAAGEVVTQRQTSIQSVGASLVSIFVKLFLVSSVYAALTGAVMASTVLGWFETDRPAGTAATKLLAAGLAVALPWTLLQFIGDISNLFFRYVGHMMVLGTIFGAVAIYYLVRDRRPAHEREAARRADVALSVSRVALVAVFAAMLAFTAAYNYPSARLYQSSGHMTEAQMDGHEAVFELSDSTYELSSIGYGVDRYRDAIVGTTGTPRGGGHVPMPRYDHDLVGYVTNSSLGDGRYLLLSERARVSRIVAYRGLRYDRSDFRAVRTRVGVDRVFDNGAVRLYAHADSGTADRG
ncbi:MAG: hypothetical protein ABEJ26_05480 [Halosimplex sp.]